MTYFIGSRAYDFKNDAGEGGDTVNKPILRTASMAAALVLLSVLLAVPVAALEPVPESNEADDPNTVLRCHFGGNLLDSSMYGHHGVVVLGDPYE